MQLLGFVDYGLGSNNHLLPDEPRSEELLSVGPGLRYTIGQWVSLRFDYGFALKNIASGDHGRAHVGVVISY